MNAKKLGAGLCFIVAVFFVFVVQAQLIFPWRTGSFDQYPQFNPEWIKKFNVKNLTFDILDKKDFQPGKDQGLVHHFDFDLHGNLTRFYYTRILRETVKETFVAGGGKGKHRTKSRHIRESLYVYDTISYRFFYDSLSRLVAKRYNDGNYYEATYFDYDSQGRILRELRCRETNTSIDRNEFTLGVQTIISDERFSYQSTGQFQYKKICLNDEGRPFKEIIIDMNQHQQVTELNEHFIVSWITQKTTFQYDQFGQLTQKTFDTNADVAQSLKDTFEYDNRGNITWERQYKNGILLNERSYLFDSANELVTSFVIRDHINKSMRIVKLMYEKYKQ
jgi:hypothetical protein